MLIYHPFSPLHKYIFLSETVLNRNKTRGRIRQFDDQNYERKGLLISRFLNAFPSLLCLSVITSVHFAVHIRRFILQKRTDLQHRKYD